MKLKTIFENKILIVAVLGIVNSIPIIWDYYHGGVPKHHLFHSADMPGFSNWWGVLTIPILTWIVITMLSKRNKKKETSDSIKKKDSKVFIGFLSALFFGILISIFWELNLEHILQYFTLLPLLVSLFRPVYLPEHFLGYVLGMVFIFGGVLPILFGIVLMIFCFFTYNVIRKGALYTVSKFN